MTIAAGFVCTDGLLICADTEHNSEAKFNQTKMRHTDSEFAGKYLVVGAGNSTYIGMACDMIEEGVYANRELFSTCDPKETSGLFREIVRQKAKSIQEHVTGYPYDDGKPTVELIVGIHSKADELSLLHVGMDGGVSTVPTGGVFIGAGAQAAIAFSRILWIESLPIETMRWIAFFLLYQAKQSAPYCGGDTQLAVLSRTNVAGVYNDEKMAEQVEDAMRLMLLHSRDTRISDTDYKIKIDAFANKLREIRREAEGSRWSEKFFVEEMKKQQQKLAEKNQPQSPSA